MKRSVHSEPQASISEVDGPEMLAAQAGYCVFNAPVTSMALGNGKQHRRQIMQDIGQHLFLP